MFKFSSSSNKNMEGVDDELKLVYIHAIKDSPIDFGIPGDGGFRTAAKQNTLFVRGVSGKCDGFNNRSRHQDGEALDYFAYINGSASWLPHHLAMVAGVIMATAARLKRDGVISIEIEWGGAFGSDTFEGWDMPHMQIKKS